MANTEKTVVIRAKLDTTDSVANVEKLKRELNDIKPIGANEQLEQLNKKLEAGNLSLGEMKRLMKDYQTVALQAGQTSPIGQEALKKAGELKDRMGDVRAQMTVMSQDGKAMNAAITISKTALQGYQAFIGIAQLAGGENKKLVETMSKMMIITQSLAAVDQVANQFRKGSVLTTYAMATAYKVMGVSAETASVGVKTFTTALAATGIGAILVAIGLLIGYFEDIVQWVGNIWDKFKQLGDTVPILKPIIWTFEALGKDIQWVKELFGGLTQEQEKYLESQQKIIDRTDDLVKATESKYDRMIKVTEAAGKDTYELERQKTMAIINLYRDQLNAYVKMQKIKGGLDEEEAKKALEVANALRDKIAEVQAMDIQHERKVNEEKQKEWERLQKEHVIRLRGDIDELNTIKAEQVEADKAFSQMEAEINKRMLEDKREEDVSYLDNVMKLAKMEQYYRSETVKNAGATFTALAGLMREGSKTHKALAIAGLIADEATSISSAVAAASTAAAQAAKNPATTLFPALPTVIWASTYLSIAASIASTIGKAKQILGTGTGSSASGGNTPSFGGSIAGAGSGTGQQNEPTLTYPIGGGGSQGGQAVGKVVVVEHDITQAQQNVSYINKISVI